MFGFKFGSKRFPYLDKDKTVYAALRGGDGESSPSEDGEFEEKAPFPRPTTRQQGRLWKIFVILLLILTNALTLAGLLAAKRHNTQMDAAEPLYTPKSYCKSLGQFDFRIRC